MLHTPQGLELVTNLLGRIEEQVREVHFGQMPLCFTDYCITLTKITNL